MDSSADKRETAHFPNAAKMSWYPGHMRKALREIEKKLPLFDVVIEVVDARVPQSSRNRNITNVIGQKARLLVLVKGDLADASVTSAWRRYFPDHGFPCLATHHRDRTATGKLITQIRDIEAADRSRRGARHPRLRPLRAMVVGVPNVGKSSLINQLVRRRRTKTGPRPGVTRHQAWIVLDEGLELLDTPGVMYPRVTDAQTGLNLGLIAALKDELIGEEALADYLCCRLNVQNPDAFRNFYKLDGRPANGDELLTGVGRRRRLLRPGGEVDRRTAAKVLLQDFREGRLGRFSLERPEDEA